MPASSRTVEQSLPPSRGEVRWGGTLRGSPPPQPSPSRGEGVVIATLALLLSACAVQDTVATSSSSTTADAGPDRNAYCEGSGPPILVGDSAGATDVCAGDLAENTFKFALCTCRDLSSGAATITVDAMDTGVGSVGVNDKLDASGAIDITGSLEVAGAAGVLGGTSIDIGEDLASAGPLARAQTSISVGGDASVGGNIELTNLSVGGTLTLPAAATINVSGTTTVGSEQRAPVMVPPPCACDSTELVNIVGFVEAHRTNNHNADIDLAPDALADFAGDVTLDLPCGRYFLDRIQGDGALTIRVDGRVALFVSQGITMQDTLAVEVAPGAELDLFVASHVNTSGDVQFGSEATPAKVRFYVGGAGAINFSANSTFGGNLYAPLMDLALSGGAEVFGSVFVSRIATSGPLTIHYDDDIESAGDTCIL